MRWSLFPKCFQGYSTGELAELTREVGLETVNAMVRPGAWVDPNDLDRSLGAFVRDMDRHDINVQGATTDFSPSELLAGDQIKIMASHGIIGFRIGWFPLPVEGAARALEQSRRELAQMESHCLREGIRAVYQVHHGTLISSPTAAHLLVRDLNPNAIGIKLDPGNQTFEGMENWDYAFDLLKGHVRAIGVKDTKPIQIEANKEQPDKGWTQVFCGLDEGVVNWQNVMPPLLKSGFDDWLVFMPFYHCSPEKSAERTAQLKRDVQVLKDTIKTIQSG